VARAQDEPPPNTITDRCTFARPVGDPVDLIVLLDSFEHFADQWR
jgi:hypothetical protein